MKFNQITVNPNQRGGIPCVRGLRIPVATVVGRIADGMTEEEILRASPDLCLTISEKLFSMLLKRCENGRSDW